MRGAPPVNGLEIAFVAVALGCDAFAVGLGVGTRFCAPRQVFRLSFHFGLFQFLMPLLGWALSRNLVSVVQQWGPWVAFGLLSFIGGKMTVDGLKKDDRPPEECIDPTRGLNLVLLSLATSMDALGVGLSLGIMDRDLLRDAVVIGVVAGAMTWCAMKVGNRLSSRWGERMEVAGGIILIGIAFNLLLA